MEEEECPASVVRQDAQSNSSVDAYSDCRAGAVSAHLVLAQMPRGLWRRKLLQSKEIGLGKGAGSEQQHRKNHN
jgi:hypothetical protein